MSFSSSCNSPCIVKVIDLVVDIDCLLLPIQCYITLCNIISDWLKIEAFEINDMKLVLEFKQQFSS